jgi:hypothetical protein
MKRKPSFAAIMAAPVMAVIAMAHPVQAQARPQGFHIPAQPLSAALLEFSRQSHELVVAAGALTADKRSHDVSGRFENEAAIRELLRGTGLLAVRNAGGGYRVTAGAPRADATPVPGRGRDPGIVVTGAQRRDQQILKVPASIAAHDKASMDRQGVRSLDDLVRLTPGLSNIATSSYGGETISIRGINSNTGADHGDLYRQHPDPDPQLSGRGQQQLSAHFDLDRVEVLRARRARCSGRVRKAAPSASSRRRLRSTARGFTVAPT